MRCKAALVITIIVALALSTTAATGRSYTADVIPTPTPRPSTVYIPTIARNGVNGIMRMTSFGDDYGSAYTFGLALMEDSWASTKTNPMQQMSGANGAWRYYGIYASPRTPITAVRKFALTSSVSSAAIEDELMLLRAATIAAGYSKLWWLDRDGSTVYWNFAECTGIKTADTYKEKGRWMKKVELTFQIDQGVWYGQTQQSWTNTMVIPASTVGRAVTGLENAGNVNALLDVRIVPHDSLTMEDSAAGVLAVSQWQHAADVDDGEQLVVLASEYKTVVTDIIDEKGNAAIAPGPGLNVYADSNFIYVAEGADGLATYSVDGAGALTLIDTDDQGGTATGVYGDGRFIYLANGALGLLTYSVDASGNLTHIDTDDQGGSATGVWSDGNFIYLANSTQGLLTYSVSDAGVLTYIDTDDQGGLATRVWGDGRFIYLANHSGGVLSYSVDGSGNLTYIDIGSKTDTCWDVWGDGTFIYVGAEVFGVIVYTVNASGEFSLVDFEGTIVSVRGVWGDGTLLYATAYADDIVVLSVDALGNLTKLEEYDPADTNYSAVWGNGTFVFVTGAALLHSLQANVETNAYADLDVGEGALLARPDINQVSWLWLPPGTTQFNVVVDCDAGGAAEEVDVFVTWWDTYVF